MVKVAKSVAKSVAAKEKFFERAAKFIRSSWLELKKVHWPTRKELFTYTAVVLVSVFLVAILLWVVDSLFAFLFELII
ncbi:MAG: preprotein translocase subunit SecE [Clostridia bacterium]|nr:preprotein translocase subunit SecE [Clostridia bacterium]